MSSESDVAPWYAPRPVVRVVALAFLASMTLSTARVAARTGEPPDTPVGRRAPGRADTSGYRPDHDNGRGAAQQDAEERFNRAQSTLAAGDPRGAIAMLDALRDDFPRDRYPASPWRAVANVSAAEIEIELGEVEAATARFAVVIDEEPPSAWKARARLGMAGALLWDRDWAAAATLMQLVVDDPSGQGGGDVMAAQLASSWLTLLHRIWLRPAAGESRWQRAGSLPVSVPLDRPVGVAAASSGVLIADEGTDAFIFVDGAGNAGSFTVPDGQRPWWSPRGEAYVAARATVSAPFRSESLTFSYPDGTRQREVDDIRSGAGRVAGGWALLDNRVKRVMLFAADGAFERVLAVGPDAEPVDIAAGPRGRLLVIDRRRRGVLAFNADAELAGGFALDDWRQPYAVATDAMGNAYVLDRDLKRIDVFDVDGVLVDSLGPTLPGGVVLDDPRDIAVDPSGRILVADRRLSAVVVIQ